MPTRVSLAHGLSGGMERHGHTLATGLAARGHEVTVVTTSHPDGTTEEEVAGVRVLYVPRSSWRRYATRWWDDSFALLREGHARAPYHAILSQSAGGLGYLAPAHARLGLPGVVVLHGSATGELRAGWSGAGTPRGLFRLARLGWRLPSTLVRWRRVAPVVARWVAVSRPVADACRREIGIPADRLEVVPVGVDTARFRPDPAARAATRQRLGIPPSAPVVALATRLEAGKGVQVALEAAALLAPRRPDVRLLIAGAGHHDGALRRRARALGLEGRARFLGLVAHDDLPAVLAAADLFVLPSLLPEGLPVSVVEAMASGLPVVASATGGTSTAVSEGVTGRLTTPGDAEQLAAAVGDLLGDDDGRRAMGCRARARAEAAFDRSAMVEAVEAVLEAAVGEPQR